MTRISDIFLERERETLSPYAFLTENTRGRAKPIPPCPNRTDYQRDRDKIIHAKSFRRLIHKTQVFLSPIDEHYRTRLTHTLEVTQIARIIARALRMNEDLTEAIAMGHDLGHTPFGHAGEDALRKCFDPGFSHYEQSLRVVDVLEKDGEGLNLTYEVRDGILHHTRGEWASTIEGRIVRYADKIAYINHDIDDACRAGILSLDDIPGEILNVLGRGNSERINNMVSSLIEQSVNQPDIIFQGEIGEATRELHAYLYRTIYRHSLAKAEDEKAKNLLISLYQYYLEHPEEMPELYQRLIPTDGVGRCVCDFISGMTDRYAISVYEKLFVPEVWRGSNT
ncbi:MAG: deoxyguanosinetriphosphate triphosphohydrolase [Clostridia bacterium]|nr:deoxyguanosinetriphosphate triphosphohydrolase [Clostridia bacterium]MDY6183911.1 deoxyguanosinetriphosphate triphosphohydrolase [Eubacteriales bacterium]